MTYRCRNDIIAPGHIEQWCGNGKVCGFSRVPATLAWVHGRGMSGLGMRRACIPLRNRWESVCFLSDCLAGLLIFSAKKEGPCTARPFGFRYLTVLLRRFFQCCGKQGIHIGADDVQACGAYAFAFTDAIFAGKHGNVLVAAIGFVGQHAAAGGHVH